MELKPSYILIKAKQLIEDKSWCQHVLGITKAGYAADSWSELPDCKAFCAMGSMIAANTGKICEYEKAMQFFALANCLISVSAFNDELGRTKEEILEAFDKAIYFAKRIKE